jgi:hypothetical protein
MSKRSQTPQRGRVALLVTSSLIGLAAAWACAPGGDDLAGRIATAVSQGDGAVVDFARLTGFPWDRLHVFPPYTRLEQITAELGFEWSLAPDIGLHEREHVNLFVFVRDGEVVDYVQFPRYECDFAGPFRADGYPPEAAAFVVREEEGGYSRWVLHPRDPAKGRS